MIQLFKIAPFIFKIQKRRLWNFIRRRKITLILLTLVVIAVVKTDSLNYITIDLSNDILFVFLIISFLPLFQDIPQIIINPNLISLKSIKLSTLKMIYFYKAILKPFIFIILINVFLPYILTIDVTRLTIIFLVRMSISNQTFIVFQYKQKDMTIFISIALYLLSYSLRNPAFVMLIIGFQTLYFISRKQLIYEEILGIYRAIFRLREGFRSDLDGFMKAQEIVTKKIYKRHKNFAFDYYDKKNYYFKIQISRLIADQTNYIPQCIFVIALAFCSLLFELDKYIILITILLISFNLLSQLINPIFDKVKQGFFIKIKTDIIFELFILPSFLLGLPFSVSIALICENILIVPLSQFIFSFMYVSKMKMIKYFYIVIVMFYIILLFLII